MIQYVVNDRYGKPVAGPFNTLSGAYEHKEDATDCVWAYENYRARPLNREEQDEYNRLFRG